jgi:hypothetical protein
MADETTKDHKRERTLRLRNQFEEQLQAARDEVPPDYACERDSEPSFRVNLSEPGRRISVEGEDADAVARMLEAIPKPTVFERVQASIAPVSRRMNSRGGRIVAILTGASAVLAAALKAIVWLQEQGLLD